MMYVFWKLWASEQLFWNICEQFTVPRHWIGHVSDSVLLGRRYIYKVEFDSLNRMPCLNAPCDRPEHSNNHQEMS